MTSAEKTVLFTMVCGLMLGAQGCPPPPDPIPPGPAAPLAPENGATRVDLNTAFSWVTGDHADVHRVHFGDTNPPPFVFEQAGTTFNPGELDPNKTYYWAIDEVNGAGTRVGDVWSFTTRGASPIATDQPVTVPFNTATDFTLAAVDPDSPSPSLTYEIVSQPARGSISGTPPNLSYTPEPDFVGVEDFAFRVSDGASFSNTARVSLVVCSRYRLPGICFSPYVDGQDPNQGDVVTEDQLRARMRLIAPYAQAIRTYGCTNGLEAAGRVAHSLGLKAVIGAWLASDSTVNQNEITSLITVANAGEADMAIVGSETLYRNDRTPEQLVAHIAAVKQAIPVQIPVGTADVYGQFLDHPEVISASDCLWVHYFPYWEGIRIDVAMAYVHAGHQLVLGAAEGRTVYVGETGHPSGGASVNEAEASPENAAFYLLNVASWAQVTGTPVYYFAALDEDWKVTSEGETGRHWGIADKNGTLKPGMRQVFDGETLADNWTLLGGPGTAEIELTHIPAYGSTENLAGRVWHVASAANYRIVVYIQVMGDSSWWVKPYGDQPYTTIDTDGRFVVDVTTGGIDQNAIRINAYLVPVDDLPSLSDLSTDRILQAAVAKAEIERVP
ncbi:MAG TPA: Ig-like domain-containing protein [Phycisphaerae bacterium]|nr:Ig-like domain-containing protein [Phycisphaerae bacterium]HRY68411.1 Ig-like domain-containing protein [Phycisphaerae bacterium]HSA27828.1 Ig-like domain-containing protein [Phycisphaerae bacterium]